MTDMRNIEEASFATYPDLVTNRPLQHPESMGPPQPCRAKMKTNVYLASSIISLTGFVG